MYRFTRILACLWLATSCTADDTDLDDIDTAEASQALAAGISWDAATGTITITGTAGNDAAGLALSGANVRATFNGATRDILASSVRRVVFQGNDGSDTFSNTTSVPGSLDGGNGDDTITGGNGTDSIYGSWGRDTLRGGAGNDAMSGGGDADQMWGGSGNDVMYGYGGGDVMRGDSGNDRIYGNSGDDQVFGDDGQDTLVAIGGGNDRVTGGASNDYLWLDVTDTLVDEAALETSGGYVHRVDQFMPYHIGDQGPIPVGKELDGPDLLDPAPIDGQAVELNSFEGSPLFASAGPTKHDIVQGSVGDCYLVSQLSAVADAYPEWIRNLIVDLGDGTYAVRFYMHDAGDPPAPTGAPIYVRVDADIWLDPATNRPRYAKLGASGSVWVPIVEKAYAFFRPVAERGTYATIIAGRGNTAAHLGMTSTRITINDGLTGAEVQAWHDAGRPPGRIADTVRGTTLFYLYAIRANLAKAQVAGAPSRLSNSTAIVADDPADDDDPHTFRRGTHVYMVDDVRVDANGVPTALVLRDPVAWPEGHTRVITDFTRIWFNISRIGVATPR